MFVFIIMLLSKIFDEQHVHSRRNGVVVLSKRPVLIAALHESAFVQIVQCYGYVTHRPLCLTFRYIT